MATTLLIIHREACGQLWAPFPNFVHTSQSDRCSVTANREAERGTRHCTSPCWTWENAGLQGFFASGSKGGCCHPLRHSPAPPVVRVRNRGVIRMHKTPCGLVHRLFLYGCITSTQLWGHYRGTWVTKLALLCNQLMNRSDSWSTNTE